MLYYSLPDEVDTHTLVDSLLMSHKTILLPRVTGEGTMELRRYTGPSDLTIGAYNIMEPTGEVYDDYKEIDLAVIPGVAFDAAYKLGICFTFQKVDSIPTDEHDIRMDEVIG